MITTALEDEARRSPSMIVAGMMSGTSADGIDVAIVSITPATGKPDGEEASCALALLQQSSSEYGPELRRAVLASMNAERTSTAELARLNWRVGLAYAEAAMRAVQNYGRQVDLIGCHGQTIYHQGVSSTYADRHFACTWQLGEMALVAAATRLPVISNFRPADMAAGGQGAPLVPFLDYALFRHRTQNRILQNLGGIGNLTAIPAGAEVSEVIAFDTGPANMIIDALMERLYAQPFDSGGDIAASGAVSTSMLRRAMQNAFFNLNPPKSAGREQFGAEYAEWFLNTCREQHLSSADTIATATAFTVESIRVACERFVLPRLASTSTDFIAAGGGTRNTTLMRMLSESLGAFGMHVTTTDAHGLPSQAKEAAAFALLAYETWHHRPSNLPAATGAIRPAILGQVIYVS